MKVIKFWLDTETTGFKPKYDQIWEFGYIIKDAEGTELERGDIYMKPEVYVSPEVLKVCKVTKEYLKSLPDRKIGEAKIIRLFEKYSENGEVKFDICGYNAEYDMRMLEGMFSHYNNSIYNYTLPYNKRNDSMKLAQRIKFNRCVDIKNNKLSTVAEYFKVAEANAHNALADITMTIATHSKLRDWAKEEYIPRQSYYKEKVKYYLDSIMDIGKYKEECKTIEEIVKSDKGYLLMLHNKFKTITLADEVLELC